jgi:hypothetical protein
MSLKPLLCGGKLNLTYLPYMEILSHYDEALYNHFNSLSLSPCGVFVVQLSVDDSFPVGTNLSIATSIASLSTCGGFATQLNMNQTCLLA